MAIDSKSGMCFRLHKLFNAMPRFGWNNINDIGFNDGIYIFFESGETYHGMDRIVRVGTHTGNGNLCKRLKSHYRDGGSSIFRTNIARAILGKESVSHPYLSVLKKQVYKRKSVLGYDHEFNNELERRVSEYMREHFSFTCFSVVTSQERKRLEEGVIATLNRSPSFIAGSEWLGKHSTKYKIAQSGMWLEQGLNSAPLSESECLDIEVGCKH